VHLHPQGGEKNLGVIYKENLNPGRSRVNFCGDLDVGMVDLVVLDRRLRATSKKR